MGGSNSGVKRPCQITVSNKCIKQLVQTVVLKIGSKNGVKEPGQRTGSKNKDKQ